ncbi:MAG: S41 family peptidase [Gemmatimonadaceae bacterium]
MKAGTRQSGVGTRGSGWIVAMLLLAGAVPLLAQQAPATGTNGAQRPLRARTTYEDLQMFSGILNQIRVNHPDSADSHELIMAAIRGMVAAADPHSYVIESLRLNPEKEKDLRQGRLHPVPVDFTFVGGAPVVVSVARGSSAARADILRGDELVAVDGQPVTAENPIELDVSLAGRKNSTVVLAFERRRVDGSFVRLERTVKRERIGEETAVPAAFMMDSVTGYVRITTFANSKVADDLHDALGRLERQGMRRLVLDLRDNGGGSVDEAAQVAGEFLPKGAVVYTSAGRKADVADTGRVKRSWFSAGQKQYPIVLVLNDGTASASELVAGALQDHDRALIVGRPSFGKSLLMQGFPLPDGSAVVMVIGHVKTPCGRVIQRQYRGITRRDYYRLARAERDTVGRPSCRTAAGRTAYGGGGIYPDVRLDEPEPDPLWLAQAHEHALLLKWTGGYLSANASAFPSLEALAAAPTLPATVLADFRRFAAAERVMIPPGDEADRQLERALVKWIAETKWGEAGLYRVSAVMDPELKAATAAFDRAAGILAGR